MVYLDTSTDLVAKNITKRGREIEKELKTDYLDKLKKSLDKYYMKDGKINTLVLILTIRAYTEATIENCCKEIMDIVQMNKK